MIIFLIAIIAFICLLPAMMFLMELDSKGMPVSESDAGSDVTEVLPEAVAEGEGVPGIAPDISLIRISPWL